MPPEWAMLPEAQSSNKYAQTRLFMTAGGNLLEVLTNATKRLPSVIGQRDCIIYPYTNRRMYNTLGYSKTGYTPDACKFAIACKAYMCHDSGATFYAHVLNLIGCALDNKEQP